MQKETKGIKAMTLRLDATLAADLQAIAEVDEMPISEAVRSAISEHIARRRQDADFRRRLRQRIQENQDILARLAG